MEFTEAAAACFDCLLHLQQKKSHMGQKRKDLEAWVLPINIRLNASILLGLGAATAAAAAKVGKVKYTERTSPYKHIGALERYRIIV